MKRPENSNIQSQKSTLVNTKIQAHLFQIILFGFHQR